MANSFGRCRRAWKRDSPLDRRLQGPGADVISGRKALVLPLPMHHHKRSGLFCLCKTWAFEFYTSCQHLFPALLKS